MQIQPSYYEQVSRHLEFPPIQKVSALCIQQKFRSVAELK